MRVQATQHPGGRPRDRESFLETLRSQGGLVLTEFFRVWWVERGEADEIGFHRIGVARMYRGAETKVRTENTPGGRGWKGTASRVSRIGADRRYQVQLSLIHI